MGSRDAEVSAVDAAILVEERPHQVLAYQIPLGRDQVFEAGRRLADVVAGQKPATRQEPERRCSPNRKVLS